MKSNKLFPLLVVLVLFGSVRIQAKLYDPDFERSFYKQIARHDLVVVHFNPYPEGADEPQLERMLDAFVNLSKRDRYRDADVAFIEVNLEKIPDLGDDYDIDVPDWQAIEEAAEEAVQQDAAEPEGDLEIEKSQQSTVMLFKEGKPLKEKGKVIKRAGFMTKSEMEDFIEVYFASLIDNIIAGKKQEERAREQVRVIKTKPVVVTQPVVTRRVYTYDDDYYYPRRRFFGPRFGIGFGFGRRGFGGIGFGRRGFGRRGGLGRRGGFGRRGGRGGRGGGGGRRGGGRRGGGGGRGRR